jgi:hypothetical protein
MTTRRWVRRAPGIGVVAAIVTLIGTGVAGANVPLTQVSADPFMNTTSQHATEVEPDTFAFGATVVATFQVGRFFNGGATDIGFVRSGDGGATWDLPGFLPGLTFTAGANNPFQRVSDPAVAYDAKHGAWMISSIPILPNTLVVPTVFVSRSTDDGRSWGLPVSIPPPVSKDVNLDKNWTACDNHPASPFYGHCYTELDNFGDGDLELMSTSTDGGLTWSTPIPTAGHDKGLGGQPVALSNGTVVVPFFSLKGKIEAFTSTNGGTSWTKGVEISSVRSHAIAGGLRASLALPSAEVDAAGRVYVAWQDCRFRQHCFANDIVFSSSTDGVNWSATARVPIDPVTSTVDHFLPGLGVDPTTSGGSAHLALTYYFYPNAACGGACRLEVGYISSPDAGAHWGVATQLAGPMALSEIAATSQGTMVGDYISTSFSGGLATTVFAVGRQQPTATSFDEAMYAPTSRLTVATPAQATQPSTTKGVLVPVTGVGSGTTRQELRRE